MTDVASGGFGQGWAHTRSYDNQLFGATLDFGNGYNWRIRQLPFLTQDGTTIVVNRTGSTTEWFDFDGGGYVARYGVLDRLVMSGSQFQLIAPNGGIETFEGFSAGTVSGKLFSSITPSGEGLTIAYDGSGRVSAVIRSTTVGSVTVNEQFSYEFGSGVQASRIASLALRRSTGGGPWIDVRRAIYTYYESGDSQGSLGDLKYVAHQAPANNLGWQDDQVYYYRYYLNGAAKGFEHGLKYVLEPASFAKAKRQFADPTALSDAALAQFADYFFEYDNQQRVTKEVTGGGAQSYSFSYTTSVSATPDGPNVWRYKTLILQPDGSTQLSYMNEIGQVMLQDTRSGDGVGRWITYKEFNSDYSVVKKADPSAVNMAATPIYDEAADGLDVQLRPADGLITIFEYYDGTDGPRGYGKLRSIRKGTSGTSVKQLQTVYGTHTAGTVTVFPLLSKTTWADDLGTEPITITYAYEFFPGTNGVWQKTTTLPTVGTTQNGSGAVVEQRMLFNELRQMVWEQGPKGFVDQFTYDPVTSGMTQRIRDVDPAELPLPTEPTVWLRPAGLPTPLNLVTDYELDSIGRTTQILGPPHEIDGVLIRTAQWTVYRDARHETLSARGYVSGEAPFYEATLVNPVSIRRADGQGRVVDEITAVRDSVAGRLCASNEFPQGSWVSWSHSVYNDAGRLVGSRAYHTIPECGDGSRGANFDETTYNYDAAGRRNQNCTPGGTITRATFDTLGRVTSTWIGTNDNGATDARPQGSGAFSPEMIPGLQFWGSAAYGLFQEAAGTTPVSTSGDPVGRWSDRRSGSLRNFYQGSSGDRPSLSPQWINGRPAVRFSQASGTQYLKLDDSLFTADASSPATIFALLRTTTSSPVNQRLIAKSSNTGDYSLALQRSEGSDKLLATMANQSNVVAQYAHDGAPSLAGDVRCVASVWNDFNLYFYRDDLLVDKQAVDNSSILTALATEQGWLIGGELRDGSPTWLCDADVAEFMIFDRALDRDELRYLFAWASGKLVPAAGNNMVQVSGRSYSNSCDCTQPATDTLYVDDDPSHNRATNYSYDYRNRLTEIDGEEYSFEQRFYDNLDRVVQADRRVGSSGGSLISRQKIYFDALGQVFKTEQFAADPTSGDLTAPLVGLNWYDAAGNVVATVAPGAKDLRAFAKSAFDGDGRRTAEYSTIYSGSLPPTYANATSITDFDRVFVQSEVTYDGAGNVLTVSKYQRFPDSAAVNKLTSATARRSSIAAWYDGIGRQIAGADCGTTPLVRPSSPPLSSDAVPVTSIEFDVSGRPFQSIDSVGNVTRRAYDCLGRTTLTVSNYIASMEHCNYGHPECFNAVAIRDNWTRCLNPGNNHNVIAKQTYNADSNLLSLTACDPDTGDQVTSYFYGVTRPGSSLASNDLRSSVRYPGATSEYSGISYSYNRAGELVRLVDNDATVHEYLYDKLGRLTDDCIVATAPEIDATVRRLSTSFDARGRLSILTSYSSTSDGEILNQIQFQYNSYGIAEREYQSHSGAVATESTPFVAYEYSDGSTNTLRPTSVTYPNGRSIAYAYGVSGSDDDLLSRIFQIKDGSLTLAEYTRLGSLAVVKTLFPQPEFACDLTYQGTSEDPLSGCVDTLGRVIQLPWIKSESVSAGAAYAYDRRSNRTSMQPLGYDADSDYQRYRYDDLARLTEFARGPVTAPKETESWNLDGLGNWSQYQSFSMGASPTSLLQSRTSNVRNQIADISEFYGASWVTPTYDRAGNTLTFPRLDNPTAVVESVYDAWGRMVRCDSETYEYDALNRRTTVMNGSSVRHFYYTRGWRIVEERVDVSESADRQFVWGLRHIDDLVCRDSSDGRFYSLSDGNANTIAVVNESGALQQRFRYQAYGLPTRLDAAGGVVSIDSLNWEYLFCGYRHDISTGLYAVRMRYFHSLLGTWLTNDPRSYSDSYNLYAYCISSPPNFVDPAGTSSDKCCNLNEPKDFYTLSSQQFKRYEISIDNMGDLPPVPIAPLVSITPRAGGRVVIEFGAEQWDACCYPGRNGGHDHVMYSEYFARVEARLWLTLTLGGDYKSPDDAGIPGAPDVKVSAWYGLRGEGRFEARLEGRIRPTYPCNSTELDELRICGQVGGRVRLSGGGSVSFTAAKWIRWETALVVYGEIVGEAGICFIFDKDGFRNYEVKRLNFSNPEFWLEVAFGGVYRIRLL